MNSFREFIYSWYFVVLAGSLLGLLVKGFLVRLWIGKRHQTAVTACPLCHEKPPQLLFVNRCSRCGCAYDPWGNIVDLAKTPAQRQERNRERFAVLEDEICVRRGVAEWDELECAQRARFAPRGNPPDRGQGSSEFKTGGGVQE